MGLSLMDWQQHVISGQLCHDGKGNLQFREALVSTARQQGKSVALQALIGWWITELAALRGKPQAVLSVANKLDRAEAIFGFIAPILVEKFGAKAAHALVVNRSKCLTGQLGKLELQPQICTAVVTILLWWTSGGTSTV